MARNNVVVRVHDTIVEGFLQPGGEVYDAVDDVTRATTKYAKAFAPVRTGNLMRNIRAVRPSRRAGHAVSAYMYANIGYAYYVEEGTTGPIRSKTGKTMHFRSARGVGPWISAESVSGQRGQHFMRDSLKLAVADFKARG